MPSLRVYRFGFCTSVHEQNIIRFDLLFLIAFANNIRTVETPSGNVTLGYHRDEFAYIVFEDTRIGFQTTRIHVKMQTIKSDHGF